MGNPYPVHTCTVSPFDSYHSNVVNRLTRLVSNYENCIFSADKIDVSLVPDSTSEILISSGSFFKDDVFITISECTVDMADGDYYISPGVGGYWNEPGYYYIVMHYVYEKARPAPRPSIRILKPSQRNPFATGLYVFLKAILVNLPGEQFSTVSISDLDPENPTVKRIYSKLYLGLEDNIPTFDLLRDYARVIIVRSSDDVYYGSSSGWQPFGGGGGGSSLDLTQLANDMYSHPVLNHDGIGILSLDLEDQLTKLRTYVGSVGASDIDPNYTSITTIATQGISLTAAASALDQETDYLRNFIGKSARGNLLPSYTSTRSINNSDSLRIAISTLDLSMGYTNLVKIVNDNSSTPNILSSGSHVCGVLAVQNTVSTNIINFTGAPSGNNSGIMITLYFGNSNTTLVHNPSLIVLSGGVNFTAVTGSTLTLVNYNGVWYEISRSGGNAVSNQSQLFTVSGTFTVPNNISLVNVTCLGGGGGGGPGGAGAPPGNSGGGAGGSGAVVYRYPVHVTPGSEISVIVGTGGAEETIGSLSSFGSFVIADGGKAGHEGSLYESGNGGNGGGPQYLAGSGGQYPNGSGQSGAFTVFLIGGSGGGAGSNSGYPTGSAGDGGPFPSPLSTIGFGGGGGLNFLSYGFGGGGGGGGLYGNGGAGGDGASSSNGNGDDGESAAANSGAGGGGGGGCLAGHTHGEGASGGSGLVLVEW